MSKPHANPPVSGGTAAARLFGLVVLLFVAVFYFAAGSPSVGDSTDGHPIWEAATGRFATAADLHIGDKIETTGGSLIAITGLTGYTASLTAYNLQISTIHTYYAGTTPVLVHNSCGMLGENGTQVTSKADAR